MIWPCDEIAMVTWDAADDFEHEFFPYQIVQAIRLTRPALVKRYQFIPHFLGFQKYGNRVALRLAS